MPHSVVQAEGGEQGDPLMPAVYVLGQHPALQAASATLLPGETVFAYLDDVHAVCQPERVHAAAGVARVVLQEHAGIEVHLGKTRVKDRPAPVRFKGRAGLTFGWRLDVSPERRGLVVLGTPGWPCQLRPAICNRSATSTNGCSTASLTCPICRRRAAPLLRAATVPLLAESVAAG